MHGRRLNRLWGHFSSTSPTRSTSNHVKGDDGLRVLICSNIKGLLPTLERKLASHPHLPPITWLQRTPAELSGASHALWKETEILLADPGLVSSLLPQATKLQWMQSTWAGVECLFQAMNQAKAAPSFELSRLGGVFGSLMAEYVMGYILLWERRFLKALELQQRKEWQQQPFVPGQEGNPRSLRGLTLGLLGFGDISQEVARCAQAFGMNVIAFKKNSSSENKGVQVTNDLHTVLRSADYLVNILPSTDLTRGLLSGDTFRHCFVDGKRPPVFINVGRGSITDEEALLHALSSENKQPWLTGAILDVFATEPLAASSPLWTHPKILITPHISAPSFPEDVADLFLANLERWRAQKPLKFAVNWENGY